MNDEYNYDEFLSDSGDDYPKYDSGVEFYPYAATKKKDVLKENIALAKSDLDRKVNKNKHFEHDLDDWFYKDTFENAKELPLSKEKKEALMEEVNRQFKSGAQRDTGCNKLRHSLIPHEALNRVAQRYLDGAEKYGENNWMKGMPLSVYYDSAMRHMHAWWSGDKNEDHVAAAVWNMLCAMWTEDNASKHLAVKGEFLDDKHKHPR